MVRIGSKYINTFRQRLGLSAARARGRQGGRPKMLDPKKRELALRLHQERQHSIAEICQIMGISKSTLYNYLGANSDTRLDT
jgi:DNA invertase Pin-like site-specific DNA recombinase